MSTDEQAAELSELRQRLSEAEETLRAIYEGGVDALVVRGPDGPQIFTLRGAQEPYRVLVERMNEGALTVSTDGTILYSNRHFADLVEGPLELIVGKPLASFVSPQDVTVLKDLLRDGVKRTMRRELSILRADGGAIPALAAVGPLVIDEATAVLFIVTDLTAQKHWEEVAAAERFARSILEQATDAVFVCDAAGRISQASWAAERLLERPLVGQRWADAVPVHVAGAAKLPGQPASAETLLRTVQGGHSFHGVEAQIGVDRLGDRHFLLSAGPLYDHAGESIGSIFTLTDITERKRSEEHQTVLVAELNHRVKNILAIVQSVAWQTIAGSRSLASFKNAFDGRLKAISLAHDILTQVRWGQVELEHLLAQSLAPYVGAELSQRVAWSGPSLLLPAEIVVSLAMVLHELATNAAKYGAFAAEAGRIEIAWRLFDEGRAVHFTWVERGGPALQEDLKPGFGSKLITRVISYDLHGKAELDFRPEGFRCTLTFPVPLGRSDAQGRGAAQARASG